MSFEVKLPIGGSEFIPDLPMLEPRKLNWMGKIIEWIRSAENHGVFHQALMGTISVVISVVMIGSIIFFPLFLYGYKEYIRQTERAFYDKKIEMLREMTMQHSRFKFLQGRLDPVVRLDIPLNKSARKQIIRDLDIPEDEAKQKTDKDLLMAAAAKYDNFLERYNLKVRSRSRWLFWRLLGY